MTPFQRLLNGDVAILARAISILEGDTPEADVLAERLRCYAGNARVVAFTGPPGAGKSTLITAYISELRSRDLPVAVLAVDPSSPLSGGAVLGDRTRMGEHIFDKHVFIRSIAARGHLGGLSGTIPAILDAVDAAGWPVIILETVGAGQSETEVVEFADVKVVLSAPGLGDDVQAIKAGILEIADVFVVNKSDLPFADRTARQLEAMQKLRPANRQNIPILKVSATERIGVRELASAINDIFEGGGVATPEERIARRVRGALLRRAMATVRSRIDSVSIDAVDTLCADVRLGKKSLDRAASKLLSMVFNSEVDT
ncbi:MAG: methylmalonyl Co-A mutase-associated GTPase MeaB [Hyphomonas sp.]